MTISNQEKIIAAEKQIVSFFAQIADLVAIDYRGDTRPIKVDDVKLITTNTIQTKRGLERELSLVKDLPFQTRYFFQTFYNDLTIRNAYLFFSPINRDNAIKFVREKWLMPLGKVNTLDFVDTGRLAHVDALSKYDTQQHQERKYSI